MRRVSILAVLALVAGLVLPIAVFAPATASDPAPAPPPTSGDGYVGPYFGENNFPPGCTRDNAADNPANGCHRIVTGLNGLDSPQVDVLVLVPVSATAERDMRIMRQSVEMWEGGIDLLAERMGMSWLAEGVDFHVTIDYVDAENGGEFTTYPIVDPEIVVIATNPVGGVGIGVDPVNFVDDVGFTDDDEAPCHPVPNLLDFEQWEALPGFDSHHETRSGTYVEDCGPEGGGGNVCFAVNGAIDPAPSQTEDGELVEGSVPFSLFDLVSHEFGHCLTIGHVGDGGEAILGNGWGKVPTNDIMSYHGDPEGLNKCVSTLDVEALAIRMSGYLDVDGDGDVDADDALEPNDQIGSPDGLNPLQVQHPQDHFYASSTGAPTDCPQPDVGELPGERTDWMPAQAPITAPSLTVDSPSDGTSVADGVVTVAGSVEHRRVDGQAQPSIPAPPPPAPSSAGPQTIEHTGTFEVQQSTPGATDSVPGAGSGHAYTLDVTHADVAVELAWEDFAPLPPSSDLDLFVTGAADSGSTGATAANPERVVLPGVRGHLDLVVRPTFVNTLTSYTLTITVTPLDGGYGGLGAPDEDVDGVPDETDACPSHPGIGADGCAPLRSTVVTVYVDGVAAGSDVVRADYAADGFSIPVSLAVGSHEVRVEWTDGATVLATRTLTVSRPAPDHPSSRGRGPKPRR